MPRATYSIIVDGNPIDVVLDPILISLSIKTDDKGTCDELSIEIDDTGGEVALPREGAEVEAEIGWDDTGQVSSFRGFLDDAHSGGKADKPQKGHGGHHGGGGGGGHGGPVHASGSRGKGRTLTLTAKSADLTAKGKVKGRRSAHKDKAKFGDVAKEWGRKAGLDDVKVDGDLASVERPYWGMANESYMAWGERTARELGATFKIYGRTGVFVPRKGGTSASGKALTPVAVTWGDNLIEWSASPVLSRPQYGSFGTRWYDPVKAKHAIETADGGSGVAKHCHGTKAAAKDHAKRQSDSNKAEGDREKGGCDGVTIDGDPDAQPGAPCTLSGIREGVDGTYKIESVTHTLTRHGGFTTRLTLKQPEDGAGTDGRSKGGA